jgi:hypothetical protein
MIFTLADIALTITWHVSTFTLRMIYNGLYYLYYGSESTEEELSRKELTEKIHELESKLDVIQKIEDEMHEKHE